MSMCGICWFDGRALTDEIEDLRKRVEERDAKIAIMRADLMQCQGDRDQGWQAFQRLRKAYAMVRYPTLNEEIKLLYDTADAIAEGRKE